MAALEWRDAYSVGDATLDGDHKRLIEIINWVDEARDTGSSVGWALSELDHYARHHFAREEAALSAAGYPELDEHQSQHGEFIAWLRATERTARQTPDAYDRIAESVSAYLKDWLSGHILLTDMAYKDFLAAHAAEKQEG